MDTLQSALYNLGLISVDSKTEGHVIVCIYWKKSSCKWTSAVQICVVWGVTVCNTVCLSTAPLMNVWVASPFWLLWTVLVWLFMCKYLLGVPTGNSFGCRPRSSIARSYSNFNFLRNLWTVFHSGHIIFHFPQQDTGFQCLHILPPLVNPVHSYKLLFLIFTLKLS